MLSLKYSTVSSVLCTMAAMSVICFIMIPSIAAVLITVAATGSISLGLSRYTRAVSWNY